jgi:hypothetical protein
MFSATMPQNYFNNPIQILHRLKAVGFTEAQAEAQVELFTNYVEENLVTKKDLKELRQELKGDLKELELRMTIKTAIITSAVVGFFSLLEKFF